MGRLGAGAAVTRPSIGTARVTGGGLAKRLGRMLLWLLVLVLLSRGLASVMAPRHAPAVTRVTRPD